VASVGIIVAVVLVGSAVLVVVAGFFIWSWRVKKREAQHKAEILSG